jgi:hypothetical protein
VLKVHLADGRTLSFELGDEAQRGAWERSAQSSTFQSTIRGVALLHNRTLHTLPLPKQFKSLRFSAELITSKGEGGERVTGERVVCQADAVRVSITAYYTQTPKMVRVDVARTGRMRFDGKPGTSPAHGQGAVS